MATVANGDNDRLPDSQLDVGLARAYSIPVSEASHLRESMDRDQAETIARAALADGGDA